MFEFFFPQWAAAEHLRGIREAGTRQRRARRRPLPPAARRKELVKREPDAAGRIEALEEDVGFLALLVLGILEQLNRKGSVSRDEVLEVMRELDGLDGARDGKLNVQVLRNLRGSEGEPGES
jgi:hypothetical protein